MMEDQRDTTVVVKGKFLEFIVDQLKTHGLPILLLSIAVWYFNGENKRVQGEVRACNQSLIHAYEVNNTKMIEVISNNTEALNRIIREDQMRPFRTN